VEEVVASRKMRKRRKKNKLLQRPKNNNVLNNELNSELSKERNNGRYIRHNARNVPWNGKLLHAS
jgi:hypothetical protein